MRARTAQAGVRLAIALVAVTLLQGCAGLMNTRVGFLPTSNSSSNRSMLSTFNPLPYQHLDLTQGTYLKAPEDRHARPFYMY